VFGVPDPKWGESVVAAVVASAPIESDALLEHCRAHIASFKKPKRIEFVDALPKNAYGKVLRRELREQFSSPPEKSGSDPVFSASPAARHGRRCR
jgi:acyl-CoA synthetase (AMP-forming)/AMP-acid ligase II